LTKETAVSHAVGAEEETIRPNILCPELRAVTLFSDPDIKIRYLLTKETAVIHAVGAEEEKVNLNPELKLFPIRFRYGHKHNRYLLTKEKAVSHAVGAEEEKVNLNPELKLFSDPVSVPIWIWTYGTGNRYRYRYLLTKETAVSHAVGAEKEKVRSRFLNPKLKLFSDQVLIRL
jgi:hypothetical protein